MSYFHYLCRQCEGVEFKAASDNMAVCFVCGELGQRKYPEHHPWPYFEPLNEEPPITEDELYPNGPIPDAVSREAA